MGCLFATSCAYINASLHSPKEMELQKQAKQMLEEIRFVAVIGQSLCEFSLSKIGADGLNTKIRSKIW